jgi:hypothetical protein
MFERGRHGPIILGALGAAALDFLKEVEDFAEEYRQRVKEHLAEHPHAIPGYHLEANGRRALSRDAASVFEALHEALPDLTLEEFISACTPSFTGLTRLLENGGADVAGLLRPSSRRGQAALTRYQPTAGKG